MEHPVKKVFLSFFVFQNWKYFSIFFQEIKEEAMEKGTAYMLFYEREGLSVSDYLPQIDSQLLPDTKDLEDELEVDFKKHCSLM